MDLRDDQVLVALPAARARRAAPAPPPPPRRLPARAARHPRRARATGGCDARERVARAEADGAPRRHCLPPRPDRAPRPL